MFGPAEKIFTVYEKPEASEPTERVVLVREGFSFLAFVSPILWCLLHRLWRAAACIMLAAVILSYGLGASELAYSVLLFAHVLLAFHVYDLQGMELKRRGYRMAGILCAESSMHAQRRYYEFAA